MWSESKEEDKIVQADTSWISASYLGDKLPDDLSQLSVIPNINRTKAPVKFTSPSPNNVEVVDFSNENAYPDMDYGDTNYRLLGLFRLWNAMEYYNPYLDILDEDWGKQLSRYIPEMIAGDGKQSHEMTISAISAKLQDCHVFLKEKVFDTLADRNIWENFLGKPCEFIRLREAEGKIVVSDILDSSCPLKVGDIILKIDSKNVEDRIKELMEYIPVSSDDKLEAKFFPYLLASNRFKNCIYCAQRWQRGADSLLEECYIILINFCFL